MLMMHFKRHVDDKYVQLKWKNISEYTNPASITVLGKTQQVFDDFNCFENTREPHVNFEWILWNNYLFY